MLKGGLAVEELELQSDEDEAPRLALLESSLESSRSNTPDA